MDPLMQRYRRRLERLEAWVNTRDGKRLDVSDASYVRSRRLEAEQTPVLVVETVAVHNGRTPTVTLSRFAPTSAYYDGGSIEVSAAGDLFDAEPGDTVELRLVKSPRSEPRDG